MNTILVMERAVINWVGRDYRRRMIRAAVASAYACFASDHPQWVAVFFDEHFLAGRAEPLWLRYQDKGQLPAPHELATLWAEQVNTTPELKRRHIAEMKPAAYCFLKLLATELGVPEQSAAQTEPPSLARLNVYA